jgi:N-acyl-D-amino-acid deacylase
MPHCRHRRRQPAHLPILNYDVVIKNGHIIDGSGNPWVSGDITIRGDRIAAVGILENVRAKRVIDAKGLVVSPGFIDMLGQSEASLLIDNRSLGKVSQGITARLPLPALSAPLLTPLSLRLRFCLE